MAGSVYLIGFMASGKTTVGALLAAELRRPFHDLDRWVEAGAGSTVAAIWQREGEAGFRARESQALAELAGREAVVATGGGTPLLPANRQLLLATGLVLWLRVPFALIWKRRSLDRGGERPLWRDRRTLRQLYAAREASYEFAHHTVDLGEEEPDVIAGRLADQVRGWEAGG